MLLQSCDPYVQVSLTLSHKLVKNAGKLGGKNVSEVLMTAADDGNPARVLDQHSLFS